MAITYIENDILVVNTGYLTKSLPNLISKAFRKQTLTTLANLRNDTVTVLDVGMIGNGSPFIKVLTSNQSSTAYKGGNGVTIYFDNDDQVNNSFEYSKAFIVDKCVFKVLNSTGSTIAKNSLVYQNGFDTAQQLPTIALASAATAATSIVLGITADAIADGECGTVVSEGSVIGDTTAFSAEGDAVYLSDTPGAISTTAGTITVIAGRILCVANPGSFSVFSSLTSGANSGGSGGGGGGTDTSTSFSNQTADFNITSSDEYTIFTNIGSSGEITGTIASGLPLNFEFYAYIAEANTFNIVPSGGEDILRNGGATSAGITASNVGVQAWLKKISSTRWAEMQANWGGVITTTNTTAASISGITGGNEVFSESTDWLIEAYTILGETSDTLLGSVDENGIFTEGSISESLPLALKVTNNTGNDLNTVAGPELAFEGDTIPSNYVCSFQSSQTLISGPGFRWLWLASNNTIRDGGNADANGPSLAFEENIIL